MSLGISGGDIIAGAKLVWDLYHKCFLVAKDAPNEFLELMRELSCLRAALKCIEDGVNARRIDESRRLAIRRTMDGAMTTLRRLEKIVVRYRKLGLRDGLHLWKRIVWITEQRDIEGFRVRIMVYTCTLNLCVSSIGEPVISTLERDFREVLRLQNQSEQNRLHSSDSVLSSDSRRGSLVSHFAGQSSYEPPITPTTLDSTRSLESTRSSSPLEAADSTVSDLIDLEDTDANQQSSTAKLHDVLARADDLLSNCPERDSVLLPPVTLDWDPPNPKNLVSDDMHRRFLTNAGRGTGDRRILTKDLLRTGTWWVLKSRNAVRLCDPPVPNTSPASTSDLNPAFYQAYFDLMRASWILYNYLLSDPDNTVNMSDEDIKSFSTLQDAIDEDFEMFRNSKISVGEIEELNSGARIWEATQPSEGAGCEQEQNPWPDPARWLTIEESHAGSDGERSHLRIFVNAELGARNVRVRTRDARYVLILWTEEGQSELKITLCNQSGTLGISRDITPEDIGPLLEEEGESNAPPAVDIKFSEMEATIHFLHISDFRRFVAIPTSFFNAVQERNPTSDETEIYRCVLKRYEHLHPNTNRPLNPNEAFHSISLRVYETTGEEGWMTTRRLVLSSSAGARQPWCLSYFLPLSNVEVKGDGALQLIVRWSDCGQKILDTDGAFNKVFSYVYDERSPNRCLGLGFGSAVDADSFEEAVLKLSLREKYRWDSTQESRYVYSIRSTSNNAEKFKGLLIRHRSPERKYSEMFYLPRDLDFELENGLGLRLLKVYCTNYVSNHVARLYDVEPGTQSKFSHCERRIRSVDLLFGSEADAQNLLRNLTDKWELNFVRQIARVSHKPTGQRPFFRMASSSSCSPAHLSLWQRGDVQRLVIRRSSSSSSPSAELYLTAVLDHDFEHDSEKMVVQRNIDITKGGLVDIATMEAVGGRRGSGSAVDAGLVKEGQTLTIEFRTFREREAFVDVSQLSLL